MGNSQVTNCSGQSVAYTNALIIGMNKIFQGLSISFISLLLVFVLLEATARVLLPPQVIVRVESNKKTTPSNAPQRSVTQENGFIDSIMDWSGQQGVRLRPNMTALIKEHKLSKQDVVIKTNSLGLRYDELQEKAKNQYRIAFFGDSITFCDYVAEEDSITRQLERLLRGRIAGKEIQVINAALPGANGSDEYYHYLEIKDQLQADLVLVGMYLNDGNESRRFYATSLKYPYSESRFLSWLINRLALFNSYFYRNDQGGNLELEKWRSFFKLSQAVRQGDYFRDPEAFNFEISHAYLDFGMAWNPDMWQAMTKITKSWRDLVRQEDRQFAVLLFPLSFQVTGKVENNYPQQQFRKMCDNLGINCFDLQAPMRQELYREDEQDMHVYTRTYFYDHCHMTKDGNEIATKLIDKWLEDSIHISSLNDL